MNKKFSNIYILIISYNMGNLEFYVNILDATCQADLVGLNPGTQPDDLGNYNVTGVYAICKDLLGYMYQIEFIKTSEINVLADALVNHDLDNTSLVTGYTIVDEGDHTASETLVDTNVARTHTMGVAPGATPKNNCWDNIASVSFEGHQASPARPAGSTPPPTRAMTLNPFLNFGTKRTDLAYNSLADKTDHHAMENVNHGVRSFVNGAGLQGDNSQHRNLLDEMSQRLIRGVSQGNRGVDQLASMFFTGYGNWLESVVDKGDEVAQLWRKVMKDSNNVKFNQQISVTNPNLVQPGGAGGAVQSQPQPGIVEQLCMQMQALAPERFSFSGNDNARIRLSMPFEGAPAGMGPEAGDKLHMQVAFNFHQNQPNPGQNIDAADYTDLIKPQGTDSAKIKVGGPNGFMHAAKSIIYRTTLLVTNTSAEADAINAQLASNPSQKYQYGAGGGN